MKVFELVDLKAKIWKIQDEMVNETILVVMEGGELTFFQQIDPKVASSLWGIDEE